MPRTYQSLLIHFQTRHSIGYTLLTMNHQVIAFCSLSLFSTLITLFRLLFYAEGKLRWTCWLMQSISFIRDDTTCPERNTIRVLCESRFNLGFHYLLLICPPLKRIHIELLKSRPSVLKITEGNLRDSNLVNSSIFVACNCARFKLY